ncbi:MAG: phage tail family protein [Actinobacteria bacterium]|nr:phage tail family protein [Actinomycetota bacterium]
MSPFTAIASTAALVVGPHCTFTRNGLVLNNRSTIECYWVDDITGFDSPERGITDQASVEETGGLADPGFYGLRTMTLSGYVQAGSYLRAMVMHRALLDSCVGLKESPMTIGTLAGAGSVFTQPDVYVDCRPSGIVSPFNIQPGFITGLFKVPFTITLRASDPTYKSLIEQHVSLVPLVVSSTGMTFDVAFDMFFNTALNSQGNPVPGTSGNIVVVTNSGNFDAPVRLRLTGPMTGVVLRNDTTDQTMYFTNLTAGEYVEVDTHSQRGSVRDQTGELKASLLDDRSDWITLHGAYDGFSGANTLTLYVDSFDAGALVDVWYRNTSV